jgi:hypothetical protein
MPDSCVKRQALIEAPSSISLIFSSRAHQSRLLESKVLFSQPQVPCGAHVHRVLDGFQLDRAKSRLGDFQRDIYADRDGVDRIKPPSIARDRVEICSSSFPGPGSRPLPRDQQGTSAADNSDAELLRGHARRIDSDLGQSS